MLYFLENERHYWTVMRGNCKARNAYCTSRSIHKATNVLPMDKQGFAAARDNPEYQDEVECKTTLFIPEVSISDEGVLTSVCSSVNNATLLESCDKVFILKRESKTRQDRLGIVRLARMCTARRRALSLEASLLYIAWR